MKFWLSFLFSILFIFNLSSIEVGGHLTEDTTWTPANNPYLVTETLFVDPGITLTILPGTEIKVSGASLTSYYEYTQNFWIHNGESIAKYIQVDGKIIAEGTEQDSIVFTRMQNDINFNWGSIYITYDAELCVFKYCTFEHMGNTGLAVSNISNGLDFFNGRGIVRNCRFLNCTFCIDSNSYVKELEIINNEFIIDDNVNPFLPNFNYGRRFILSSQIGTNEDSDVLICNNYFNGSGSYFGVGAEYLSFAFNTMVNCISNGGNRCFFYNNEFYDCIYAIHSGYSLYIKKNNFIGGIHGVNLDYAYIEISDNYFEDCSLITDFNSSGSIYNNKINDGKLSAPGQFLFFNNMVFNNHNGTGICATFQRISCTNNISINNLYAFEASESFDNCILIGNENLEQFGVTGNPIFRNCIIDFELEYPLIDGGGNIIVDSLQAQSIFVDIQNGDFHLAEGSIAIDAGFDTLGYYYPFDMDYNHRVWDGDGNGTAIIDIGPYEFGAPAFGGIQGITYDPINGEPVDYVLIKINNISGEFTFSDSVGNYEYKLPAGAYDVYAERVFYDDIIEYQIEVIDGQFTQLDIAMSETVNIQNNEIAPVTNDFNINNFPNPFNPSTTISFSIQNDDSVELSIFNIKGQKVSTLINEHLSKGEHSIVWSGYDQNGNLVSSGIYLYKIEAGNQESVKRMLLLK